jgi:hypothetical protein
MGTTKLTVEFVISGVIMSLAVFLLANSLFTVFDDLLTFIDAHSAWISANWGLLAIIGTSISYGLGVVSEYLGLVAFEWLLNKVKEKRMQELISSDSVIIQKSPLLLQYKSDDDIQMTCKEVSAFYGDMRFHVMMENSRLYTQIEMYMNRFLLIRVLFLAEVIVLVSFLIGTIKAFSALMASGLIFVALIAWANFYAVKYQFEYYCRAIERSYKALLIGTAEEHNKSKIRNQEGNP